MVELDQALIFGRFYPILGRLGTRNPFRLVAMHADPENHQVFISAAEPSADLHAAKLIDALRTLQPGLRLSGVAGPKMRQAGCESIYDMTQHSSMLMGVFKNLHRGYEMLRLSAEHLEQQPFSAAIVIDSPVINLRIAKKAKSLGIPVLYYIAPQMWACAGRYRIGNLRACADRVACILPFEEPYFRAYGIEASYVGHPLFATLAGHTLDDEMVQRLKTGSRPILAILPGSRRHVVAENFPSQLQVARRLRTKFPQLKTLISAANGQVRPILEDLARAVDVPVEFHDSANAELLSAADLALIASGTATLEAAYHHTPMIVMYNSSRLIYQFVRYVLTTKHFSLPNILAGRELVPEFMPYYRSIDPIVDQAASLLDDEPARRRMSAGLAEMVRPFLNTTASETTAKILLDMIEAHRSARGARR